MDENFEIYNNTLTNESLAQYANNPVFNTNKIYNVPVSDTLDIEATDGDVLTYDSLTGEIHFEPIIPDPNPVYNANKIYNVNVSPTLETEAKEGYILTYDSIDSNIKFEPPTSTFTTITTDAFQLSPAEVGNILQCNTLGFMEYIPQYTTRCIVLKPDANDALPLESSTLYGAVQKASALVPTATSPIWINIYNGTYYETQSTILDPTMLLVTIAGPLQYWGCQFFLTVDLGPGSVWITHEAGGGEWSDVYFDGQMNCDHVFKVDGTAGGYAAVDLMRVIARNGRVSQFYVDNGALIYNIFGVPWPAVTSTYGVLVDNASEYIADICTTYVGDSDLASNCIYNYIDNGSTMTMLNDSQYGSSYIVYGGVPTNSVLVSAHNGSDVSVSSGRVFDFDVAFELFTGSSMITRNVNFESSNTFINNTYDSTCIWNSLSDLFLTSQLQTTGLTSDNTTLLYKDTSLNDNPGIRCIGDLSVGLRGFNSRSFFGEGGSDVADAHVLLTNDNIVFTAVTQDLLESNRVPTTLFGSLTTGTIYIGDVDVFATIQFNITQTITIGTAVLSVEYWNGLAWTAVNYMASNSEPPYNTYANNLFTTVTLQSIRLDIILQRTGIWATTTVNGIANHYWIRIRISAGTMTTSPIADYFKIYGNTTSITRYGNILCHGLARTLKNIPYDMNSTNALVTAPYTAPNDLDIWASQSWAVGRQTNLFNTVDDNITLCFMIPSDFDSSCALSLRIAFIAGTTAAAQTGGTFNVKYGVFNTGSQLYLSRATAVAGPVTGENQLNVVLTPDQTNGTFLTIQNIPFYLSTGVSSTLTGDITQIIMVTIRKTVNGTSDTIFVQTGLYYYSWRLTDIFIP